MGPRWAQGLVVGLPPVESIVLFVIEVFLID
jgi:hypothetical protein